MFPKDIKLVEEYEQVEVSKTENLSFKRTGDVNVRDIVNLHDKVNGELGWFEIWYDNEEDDREYICLNNEITYLDELKEN